MTNESFPENPRVLVVDDHDISRQFTAAALQQCNSRVEQASTAQQAIETAASLRPQMVFMDLNLPDLDGFETITRIRADWPAKIPEPKFVLLTGDGALVDQVAVSRHDLDAVLIKPVSARQLNRLVHPASRPEGPSPAANDFLPELKQLFREELFQCIPRLERVVSKQEPGKAVSILHRLIASSAICREIRLESALRRLDTTLRRDSGNKKIAAAYFQLLDTVEEFTARSDFPGR